MRVRLLPAAPGMVLVAALAIGAGLATVPQSAAAARPAAGSSMTFSQRLSCDHLVFE